jgi:hypothetical protein
MITKEEFVKHCKIGQPTKYKGEEHIGLLFEVFKRGEGMLAFCAESLISKQTFYDWLEDYKEFKDAYDIALCLCGKWWESYPLTNPDFNYPYWATIMRNRFGYGKTRVRIPKDVTPTDKINAVLSELEKGELSTQEATQLASVINTQANILLNQPQEPEQFKRDTTEQLMAKIQAIQGVLDYADRK